MPNLIGVSSVDTTISSEPIGPECKVGSDTTNIGICTVIHSGASTTNAAIVVVVVDGTVASQRKSCSRNVAVAIATTVLHACSRCSCSRQSRRRRKRFVRSRIHARIGRRRIGCSRHWTRNELEEIGRESERSLLLQRVCRSARVAWLRDSQREGQRIVNH